MRKVLFAFLLVVVLFAPGVVLAQCSGGSESTGQTCGAISHVGCCVDGSLYFCEGKELCKLSCEKMPECGWREDRGYYDCATPGAADPAGLYPLECPADDNCMGINYRGCCASSTVYWCADNQLASLDCAGNDSKNICAIDPESGAADCVKPGEGESAPVCPFAQEGTDAVIPDIQVPDVGVDIGGGDGSFEEVVVPDIVISVDDIVVPDVEAPDECVQLQEKYVVTQSNCVEFGQLFYVKQAGCVSVLAGLTPGKSTSPVALVTKQSLSFGIPESTIAKQCAGELVDSGVKGTCFWMGGQKCTFTFTDPSYSPPVSTDVSGETDAGSGEEKKSSSGGCAVVHGGSSAPLSGLLILLLVILAWAVRQRREDLI